MQKRAVFIRQNVFPVLTALIWGTAFVAQSVSTDHVGPLTFTTLRSVIAFAVLAAGSLVFSAVKRKRGGPAGTEKQGSGRDLIVGGICCGVPLAVASNLQQLGLGETSAGKAGFITALYIIMVPLAGIFLGKKIAPVIWFCVALAISGFYLLCVKEGFSVSRGDVLVLICAICFTGHILTIDHFSALNTDPVKMSCIQFATAAFISGILMLIFEHPTWDAIRAAGIPILYAGILSSGAAYTLQIIGQRYTDPTTATLIMSLESVFAALAGWLILHETLSFRELLGCVLVFAAVILAQIPLPDRKNRA